MASAEDIVNEAKSLTGFGSIFGWQSLDATIPGGFVGTANFSSPIINAATGMLQRPAGAGGDGTNDLAAGGGGGGVTWGGVPGDGSLTYEDVAEPTAATYAGVETAIEFAKTPLPDPQYGVAVIPNTLPTSEYLTPDLKYSQAGYQTIPTDAGLEGVGDDELEIGERFELDMDGLDELFEPIEFLPLDAGIPDLQGIDTDVASLEVPNMMIYTDDAGLLSDISNAATSGEPLDASTQELMLKKQSDEIYRAAFRKERDIMEKVAAQGFFRPTGPATGALVENRYDAWLAVQKANDAVESEAFKRAQAVVVGAMEAGGSLRDAHMRIGIAWAGEISKIQKINVRMMSALLKASITIFNEKLSAVKIFIGNYKEYISAVGDQNRAVGAISKGINAQIETVNADVSQYKAQIGTLESAARLNRIQSEAAIMTAEEYSQYVQGELSNLGIARKNIEAFQAAVGMYKEASDQNTWALGAEASAYDAWASAIGVDTNNAQLTSTYNQGVAQNAQAYDKFASSISSLFRAQLEEYNTFARVQREYFNVLAEKLENAARAQVMHLSIQETKLQGASEFNQAEASWASATNALNLNHADQETRQSALIAQNAASQARIDAGRLAARAQAAAGGAQAAYGVSSNSIRLAGNLGIGQSRSRRDSVGFSTSGRRSYDKSTRMSVNG